MCAPSRIIFPVGHYRGLGWVGPALLISQCNAIIPIGQRFAAMNLLYLALGVGVIYAIIAWTTSDHDACLQLFPRRARPLVRSLSRGMLAGGRQDPTSLPGGGGTAGNLAMDIL